MAEPRNEHSREPDPAKPAAEHHRLQQSSLQSDTDLSLPENHSKTRTIGKNPEHVEPTNAFKTQNATEHWVMKAETLSGRARNCIRETGINTQYGIQTDAVESLTKGFVRGVTFGAYDFAPVQAIRPKRQGIVNGSADVGGFVGALVPYELAATAVGFVARIPQCAERLSALNQAGIVGRTRARATQGAAVFGLVGAYKETLNHSSSSSPLEGLGRVYLEMGTGAMTVGFMRPGASVLEKASAFSTASTLVAMAQGELQPPVRVTGNKLADTAAFNFALAVIMDSPKLEPTKLPTTPLSRKAPLDSEGFQLGATPHPFGQRPQAARVEMQEFHRVVEKLTPEMLESEAGAEEHSRPIFAAIYPPLVDRITGGQKGLNVLELGHGTSIHMPSVLSDKVSQYVGLDWGVSAGPKQRAKMQDSGVRGFQIRSDIYDGLPIKPNSQDLVVANCVPALLTDPIPEFQRTLSEVAGALKPGGHLIIYPWLDNSPAVRDSIKVLFQPVDAEIYLPDSTAAHAFRKR